MHDASLSRIAHAARNGPPEELAEALTASRADTLATFDVYEGALPGLAVPRRAELNPPLWELGHIGWFQEYWIARNPECGLGHRADPDVPRQPPRRGAADGLYHSSRVPHESRWQLPLPDAMATRDELARQLDETLDLLRRAGTGDDALYFFRLALAHEDMHHEAALYMACVLGIEIEDPRWQARPLPPPGAPLAFSARRWPLGSASGAGFAFDNELPGRTEALQAFEIDRQAVRWAEFLPFVKPVATTIRAGGARAEPAGAPRSRQDCRATYVMPHPGGSSGAAVAGVRSTRAGLPVTSPCTKPRPGAAGPGAACPPRPSGKARPAVRLTLSGGATCGNGPPVPSRRIRVSSRTPIATIPRRGSTGGRYCAAPPTARSRACATRATATSFPPHAMMSRRVFAPARCSWCSR
jgi:hypothetical protein